MPAGLGQVTSRLLAAIPPETPRSGTAQPGSPENTKCTAQLPESRRYDGRGVCDCKDGRVETAETSGKTTFSGQFWLVPVIAKMDALKVNLYRIAGMLRVIAKKDSMEKGFPPRVRRPKTDKEENKCSGKGFLIPDRVRRITGGFSFIPHRFLADGFLASLEREEILLYLFLILAPDRHGLSCYGYDAICTLLEINLDEYIAARDGLIGKDLISFDGRIFPGPGSPGPSGGQAKTGRSGRCRLGRTAHPASLREADQRRMGP